MPTIEQHEKKSFNERLSLWDGVESLGLLVSDELEKRWANGSNPIDPICHYALVPSGKMIRPILLLDSALAVGGDLSPVLPAAVGAECGHVASLIHDDIIDGDDLRRGRPSVQHRFGVGDAIVAGDALIFDLFAGLAECRTAGAPDSRVVSALYEVAGAGLDLCRGQSLESELTKNPKFEVDAYLTVARLKTASFFRGACACGAILGGGSPESVAALSSYGDLLGTSFQIHDDLLAYICDTDAMGKPETSDVQNGRLTLPVILAYQAGGPGERGLILDCFSCRDAEQALAELGELLERTGAITEAARMAHDLAKRAKRSLDVLSPSPSRDRLGHFADLAGGR